MNIYFVKTLRRLLMSLFAKLMWKNLPKYHVHHNKSQGTFPTRSSVPDSFSVEMSENLLSPPKWEGETE